jgi:hypothetical protein
MKMGLPKIRCVGVVHDRVTTDFGSAHGKDEQLLQRCALTHRQLKKEQVKLTLEQAMRTQRGSGGLTLLFL